MLSFPGPKLQVHNAFYTGGVTTTCLPPPSTPKIVDVQQPFVQQQQQTTQSYYFPQLTTPNAQSLVTSNSSNIIAGGSVPAQVVTPVTPNQPIKFQSVTSHSEVSQVSSYKSVFSGMYLFLYLVFLFRIQQLVIDPKPNLSLKKRVKTSENNSKLNISSNSNKSNSSSNKFNNKLSYNSRMYNLSNPTFIVSSRHKYLDNCNYSSPNNCRSRRSNSNNRSISGP